MGSVRIDRQCGAVSRYARFLHRVRGAAGLIDDDNSRLPWTKGPAHWLAPSLGDLCNGLKQNGKALFHIFDASSGQQPRNLYKSQQTRVCRQTIGAVNVKATAPHKSAVTHACRLLWARSERQISPLKCRDQAT